MTHTIIAITELQRLAHAHAMAVVTAEATDGSGQTVNRQLLEEFRQARQPFLSDKQYTALYRTYINLFTTAVTNHYAPGSAVAAAPVRISSIKDGEEIYRPNAVPMSATQWDAYSGEVVQMAERFAREIAVLAAHGGDTDARMKEQQFEAAKFSLDHGLNEEEQGRETKIYKDAFMNALEHEVNERTRGR